MTVSRLLEQTTKFPPIHLALVFLYRRAGLTMSREIAPYVRRGSRMLDIGCGTGIIGSTIANQLDTSIVGTDVRDVREMPIPFSLTQGNNRLPFSNKTFDVVLISYVLHHVEEAETLLKEARRVCSGTLIIYEDTPRNIFHRLSCLLHGFSYGSFFGIKKKCRFRTKQEWLVLFHKLKLSPVDTKNIQFFNPVHVTTRSLFVLSSHKQ